MAGAATDTPAKWQERAAAKYAQVQKLIPEAWTLSPAVLQSLQLQQPLESSSNDLIALDIPRRSGILTPKELQITEAYTVQQLLKALASGRLTALEVTTAFCKRAAIAQQLTSSLTEIMFQQAQERAKELDQLHKKGQLAGPLHGLPISLKDAFQVQGTDATLGFVGYLDNGPSNQNSSLVDVLLGLGAVLYCKTNIPQTLMTADSHNHIFGRTLNPHNTSLTAGGSSGGEGALVAFRASPLGVGTDVAGSVRIPAVCCGVYGFRPTASRIPYGRQAPLGNPGLKSIVPSAGPLANDMDALAIFMEAVLSARPARIDASCFDLPWRHTAPRKSGAPMRFGVLAEDPAFPLHPPVKVALADAVALLQKQGHETVPLTPNEGLVAASYDVAMQIFGLDKTSAGVVSRAGEPFIPSIDAGRRSMRVTKFDRVLVPDTRKIPNELDRLATLHVKCAELREMWRKVWLQHGLDAVIAPGGQGTAVEHDQYGLAPYTALLNFLDYPACAIPFGKATKRHLAGKFELPAGSSGPPYNPGNLEGAPLSVQVFTTRMRDEECLEIAKQVDRILNGTQEASKL